MQTQHAQHASPDPTDCCVHIWRHFAVLTNLWAVGHKQDHLFLVREGVAISISWKFKVVTSEPLFDIGTMAGLIMLFSRHSGILTNFRIFDLESRLIGPEAGYGECEEPGVRRGPDRALECPVDADNALWGLVGPWQYQCSGVRVLGGWWRVVPTQYPPSPPTPGTPLPTHHCTRHYRPRPARCTNTQFETDQGDPRGK